MAACPPASTRKRPTLLIFSAQLHRLTSATAFCSRCSHLHRASKLISTLLHVLEHPATMAHSNPISVQSMPRSPELCNLLGRTICTGPEPTYSCSQEHKCAYQRGKRYVTCHVERYIPCSPIQSCVWPWSPLYVRSHRCWSATAPMGRYQ